MGQDCGCWVKRLWRVVVYLWRHSTLQFWFFSFNLWCGTKSALLVCTGTFRLHGSIMVEQVRHFFFFFHPEFDFPWGWTNLCRWIFSTNILLHIRGMLLLYSVICTTLVMLEVNDDHKDIESSGFSITEWVFRIRSSWPWNMSCSVIGIQPLYVLFKHNPNQKSW